MSYTCFVVVAWNSAPAAAAHLEGVDISHWQGALSQLNWNSVQSAGKSFAFIKASEGVSFADPQFVNNISRATTAGILAGAYHYARPDLGNSAVAEANWFVNQAGSFMQHPYLRPVLDLEVAGVNSTSGRTFLSNWINDFMNRVVALKGPSAEPIVYMNTNYATNYVNSTVANRTLWIANWPASPNPHSDNPGTGVFPTWAFWQYTSSGSVPGISGRVDLDVAHGDMNFVRSFMISEPSTSVFACIAVLIAALAGVGLSLRARKVIIGASAAADTCLLQCDNRPDPGKTIA
ncbi:MAG: glycoside hydrolase family 25 protein [Pirellulales bacterium]|nr:glycoside hydrolase family 25 protein [Pirellulales bacterium]